MKQVKPVRALCESAILLALAVVLSYVKFFQLPFDGAITLASMLPICLISIRFGIKWGLGAAFCYSWSQILQGGVFSWGLTPGMLIASLLMDFLIAFTVLGLAGLFRKQGFWNKTPSALCRCSLIATSSPPFLDGHRSAVPFLHYSTSRGGAQEESGKFQKKAISSHKSGDIAFLQRFFKPKREARKRKVRLRTKRF